MIMKYKDFKMLSNDDMKQIVGGDAPEEGSITLCNSDSDCATAQGWVCSVRASDGVKRCVRGTVVF